MTTLRCWWNQMWNIKQNSSKISQIMQGFTSSYYLSLVICSPELQSVHRRFHQKHISSGKWCFVFEVIICNIYYAFMDHSISLWLKTVLVPSRWRWTAPCPCLLSQLRQWMKWWGECVPPGCWSWGCTAATHQSASCVCCPLLAHWSLWRGTRSQQSLGRRSYWSLASNTPRYTQVHPGTPRYTRVHPGTARYTQLHPGASRYTQLHPGASRYTQVHPGTLRCIQVHSGASRYTQVHPGTPRYTQLHPGTARYTQVHPGTLRYSQVHSGASSDEAFSSDKSQSEKHITLKRNVSLSGFNPSSCAPLILCSSRCWHLVQLRPYQHCVLFLSLIKGPVRGSVWCWWTTTPSGTFQTSWLYRERSSSARLAALSSWSTGTKELKVSEKSWTTSERDLTATTSSQSSSLWQRSSTRRKRDDGKI